MAVTHSTIHTVFWNVFSKLVSYRLPEQESPEEPLDNHPIYFMMLDSILENDKFGG